MANRSLLHRNKLELFKEWLLNNNYDISKTKGDYEAVRWKGKKGEPMPMIYDRHRGDHLTGNDSAVPYVYNFLKDKKNS